MNAQPLSAAPAPVAAADPTPAPDPPVREEAFGMARAFLDGLDERPAAASVPEIAPLGLRETGLSARGALDEFAARYAPWMSGSAGPRYFGFVTGGATPAALAGDWLASAYDQNVSHPAGSAAARVADDALAMARELLGLPAALQGVFVSGATMSNAVGLAVARQWVGLRRGVDASVQGLAAVGPVRVLSGTAHSSVTKSLSLLGLGRSALRPVGTPPGREAVDVAALEAALRAADGPCIVVANAGTVITTDFDDFPALAALRERYPFWLHVDGAFGAFAAVSARHRHLVAGMEAADSLTVDFHKWLNVPYDSAAVFVRDRALQADVFRNGASYLASPTEVPFAELGPENSQRFRALAAWMSLAAYGRSGYAEIVERCCRLAEWLGGRIDEHPEFRLLAPVRLNGVCFTLAGAEGAADGGRVARFLERVQADGTAFLTAATYGGVPAVRISVSNWRTRQDDVERTWDALQRVVREA